MDQPRTRSFWIDTAPAFKAAAQGAVEGHVDVAVVGAGAHNGVHHAMGYSGHGVQMSVYMGSIMAEVICGRHKANPWADLDWPAVPAPVSAPWFLPMIGAYYRMLDVVQ